VTPNDAAGPGAAEGRQRILEPSERFSEILFGLIMVLTFTGSLSAATSGQSEVRTMLVGAIGCNLAWGIVDAIMYLLGTLGERGSGLLTLRRLRDATEPEQAHRLLAGALPPLVASLLRPDELETLRRRLAALPEPPRRAGFQREDFLGALGVFLLVFLSTVPVVVPFLLIHDAMLALRVSNAVAIALLFAGGYSAGKRSGHHPWQTGLAMVGVGVLLVAITIALGG
jgi:hypothetical protein